ncbi:3-isopropylmalate dehydratase small subunit [Algicola sagamiensis]|uniref:3-isopropylmalate dehydratase small subunit n=1 Tax=Algicola sagamiensis TaxID=163869 RepID=UPI0003616DF4|nr:3-isopropylmalate dehydratase small subunit [Algicola sagamiensis]
MQFFHSGQVLPLDRNNVDTDQIIPKQFLTSVDRDGFAEALFFDWRYHDDGSENTDFILNHPDYQRASILLTQENFGCGSSREHAPWALQQWGFEVIIAPSFADIFFNNCVNNNMLPITLPKKTINDLFALTANITSVQLDIDLANQMIHCGGFAPIAFDIDPEVKRRLLSGLDFIGQTEQHASAIHEFEQRYHEKFPWLNPF